MKRLSLIIAAVMILNAVFCVSANAYDPNSKTVIIKGVEFEYRVIDNKYVEILKGADFIPKKIDGYPVVMIGDGAIEMWGDDEIVPSEHSGRKWIIPDTVTYIGNSAFRDNIDIKTIEIPSSVTHIGKFAFLGCINLKNIEIPSSVREIPESVFGNCRKLEEVTLSNKLRYIGEMAFLNCPKLKKINIPEQLEEIGSRAFYCCPSLKKIDFSGCYQSTIGNKAFGYYDETTDGLGYYNPKKNIAVKKIKDFTIIDSLENSGSAAKYAEKNKINLIIAHKSEMGYAGACGAGFTLKVKIDGKSFSDCTTKNPKIIKITKKGKVTALKKGRATVKATLSNGKKYSGIFIVKNDPALKKKATSGRSMGKYKEVREISVGLGKTVSVKLFGKASAIDNKYCSTNMAKITSKKSATSIKIQGKAKGISTVKVKVNGVKTLKLKVTVK